MSVKLPAGPGEAEFTERKSRFIGNVFLVRGEAEAKDAIASVRARHGGASHVVYAYDIASENAARFSDDGEPKGTAGIPVFEVFRREGLTYYCCTVTRYFGGILLGAGGLIRAYAAAAKAGLDAAGIAVLEPFDNLVIYCDYPQYEIIRALLRGFGHEPGDVVFTDRVAINLTIPSEQYDLITESVTERTAARAEIIKTGTLTLPRRI